MSESKHTPGPWWWRREKAKPVQGWYLAPGVLIADGNDGTPGGDEMDRANANLIAAAPDLLNACEEAFDFLGGADGASAIRAKLLNAILKAGSLP